LYPDAPQSYFKKDWVKEGVVAQLHSRDDDGFMPRWKRAAYYAAPFLAIATLSLYWLYFALRIRFVISAQNQSGKAFPLAWVFIVVEISVAVPILLQSFWSVFILKKRHRPKLRLIGEDVPTVDVFITCCGEDDDLILDTVRAACDVDYPQDRFRVVVLDDGKSVSLQRAVENLRDTYHNVHYKCRPKFPGVPHHFKAGNLNYGVEEMHNMTGGPSEFIAALDADMIPERDWLRAIMPHLLIDEKMALACPPQVCFHHPPVHFTNGPSFSTMFLLATHCARAWIFSSMSLNP
jgi:Glycosyl transferase family 2